MTLCPLVKRPAYVVLTLIYCLIGVNSALGDIPKSASEKFEELCHSYGESMGATLSRCIKGDEILYVVSGSGGFTVSTFVYSTDGKLLSQDYWSDDGTGTKGTIDIRSYQCSKIDEKHGALSKGYDEDRLRASYEQYIDSLDSLKIPRDYSGAVKLLISDTPKKQIHGLKVLGETAMPEVIPWIVPLLDSTDRSVAVWAASSLEKVISSIALQRRDPKIGDRVVLKSRSTSDPDLRPLAWLVLKLLRKPEDVNMQASAASMVRYLELTEFKSELQALLKSKHPAVVTAAQNALTGLGL